MSMKVTPGGSRGQRTPPGPLGHVLSWFMRTTHRLGARRMDGMPVISLTTRGARSGELRTSPVISFADGESAWLVVASSGGSARHQAWFLNMARHPNEVWVEIDGRRVEVTPSTLDGEARQRAWERITARSRRFAEYQEKTDREIPVVRLAAVPS